MNIPLQSITNLVGFILESKVKIDIAELSEIIYIFFKYEIF